MPSVYDLKPRFQNLLRPLLRGLVARKITPNMVTVLALIGSVVIGLLVGTHPGSTSWLLLLPIWLFIRMALNAIDGMMAREFDLSSNLGAVLNELGDVLSDIFLYLPMAWINERASLAVIFFVTGAIVTEFCGVLGKALGATRHYEGPMGKSDRAFFVGLLAILTFFFPKILNYWGWIFAVGFLLTVFTCWNRTAGALKELRGV
jgi:phosphatidylglycerophosphate synthase